MRLSDISPDQYNILRFNGLLLEDMDLDTARQFRDHVHVHRNAVFSPDSLLHRIDERIKEMEEMDRMVPRPKMMAEIAEVFKMKTVPERLEAAAEINRERGKVYGDNYKRHGMMMMALFPKGVTLGTHEDFNRFGLLNFVVSKVSRYCENFDRGGHEDSLDDLSVYAQMLAEVDEEARRQG